MPAAHLLEAAGPATAAFPSCWRDRSHRYFGEMVEAAGRCPRSLLSFSSHALPLFPCAERKVVERTAFFTTRSGFRRVLLRFLGRLTTPTGPYFIEQSG